MGLRGRRVNEILYLQRRQKYIWVDGFVSGFCGPGF